jgi:hypothetical protein
MEIKTKYGKLTYEDRSENLGETNLLIRQIVGVQGDLEKKLSDRRFYSTPEGLMLLRELTNGRYPSYFTISHACGGSDNGASRNLDWFNQKGYDLFDEEIIEGLCIASPVNNRAFMAELDDYTLKGWDKFEKTLGHTPLFVFGMQNPNFAEFLLRKYEGINDLTKLKDLTRRNRFSELTASRTEGTKWGGTGIVLINYDERVTFVSDLEEPKKLYANRARKYGYHPINALIPEEDYAMLFDLPIWAEDCDGGYVTTDGSRSYVYDNGAYKDVPENQRKPLRWKDSEMMIDMYGLFDGERKVVFFNPDKQV